MNSIGSVLFAIDDGALSTSSEPECEYCGHPPVSHRRNGAGDEPFLSMCRKADCDCGWYVDKENGRIRHESEVTQ